MTKVEGQQVECRRRENRGAVGAEGVEGVGFGEGVPSPMGRDFLIFYLDMLHIWCNLMHFQT